MLREGETVSRILVPMFFLIPCLSIAASATAGPARVEVGPLANATDLSEQDVEVVRDLIVSELSALPGDRFSVSVSEEKTALPCDVACLLEDAAALGIDRVVTGSIKPFGGGFVGLLELYEPDGGQLLHSASTTVAADPAQLLTEMKALAARVRELLLPLGVPAAVPEVAPPLSAGEGQGLTDTTALLRVTTDPPGAKVHIQRLGNTEYAGVSPIEKILKPVEYRVIAKLPEHEDAIVKVRLDPMETETLHISLQRIYPMSPHKKLGHVLLWPGLGITAFGIIAGVRAATEAEDYTFSLDSRDREDARSWTGVMWTGLGLGVAMMATGVILWVATPSSEEYWKRNHDLGFAPVRGGAALAYGGRF